ESEVLARPGRDTPDPWAPRARRHELSRDGWRPDIPASRILPASNPGAVGSAVMVLVVVHRRPATCPVWRALPTTVLAEPDAAARRFAGSQTTPARWRVRVGTPGGSRCYRGTDTCRAGSATPPRDPLPGRSGRDDPCHASPPETPGATCPSRARQRPVRVCLED